MYAVVKIKNQQYRVSPDLTIQVPLHDNEVGETLTFDEVLMIGDGLNDTPALAAAQGLEGGETLTPAIRRAADVLLEEAASVGTGYGRATLPFPKERIRSEILCHGLGAHWMFPKTATVLDIGGQENIEGRTIADLCVMLARRCRRDDDMVPGLIGKRGCNALQGRSEIGRDRDAQLAGHDACRQQTQQAPQQDPIERQGRPRHSRHVPSVPHSPAPPGRNNGRARGLTKDAETRTAQGSFPQTGHGEPAGIGETRVRKSPVDDDRSTGPCEHLPGLMQPKSGDFHAPPRPLG